MDIEKYSYRNIEQYSYGYNPEIPDRVWQEIRSFVYRFGREPKALIVGYGTYIALCWVVTNRQRLLNQAHTPVNLGSIIKINNWEGFPLIVDPGYEYRVVALHNESLFDQAITAICEAQKPVNKKAKD